MHQQLRIAAAGNRRARAELLILVGGALLIAGSILIRPSSHDEGQYVGAIALMRSGWPYRDFAYLQTPLQPLLLSPLAVVPAGWLLAGARAVNGFFALTAAWLLFRQLRPIVAWRSAAIAVAALLCTNVFLLAASQARNDALPLLLLVGGQGVLLAEPEERPLARYMLAGLLFGLATSAKINAALPAAGAGLFALLQVRRRGSRPLLAFLAGGLAGLLPCAVAAALAPQQFRFDVFAYALDAPMQWWSSIGHAYVLSPAYRIGRLLLLSLPGVIVVGLIAIQFDRRRTRARTLLNLILAGGIVGAYLPEPAFGQYLVPVLPALVARFALAIDGMAPSARRVAAVGAGVGALCGLVPTVGYMLRVPTHGLDLVRTIEAARAVSKLARGGLVVTLAPERIAGSDVELDPRFVTGPFLFRTFGPLSAAALRFGLSPNWQRVGRALDERPPAVIVVGAEQRPFAPMHPEGLDRSLADWASARSYRPVSLPGGQSTAFVAPPERPFNAALTFGRNAPH